MGGVITTYFGEVGPYSPRGHQGVDISASHGTPVRAAGKGRVLLAGWTSDGYGYNVVIEHRSGVQTKYAHLSRVNVAVDDTVGRGEHIGLVGSTGYSTGPHLHLEFAEYGALQNPLNYLP